MRSFLALFLVALVISALPASAQRHGNPDAPIRTVEALNLAGYTGLRDEIARFPNRFERGCHAVTVEDTLRQDGTIGGRNAAVRAPATLRIAEGSARVAGVGRLSVNFVRFLPLVRGDYFVLDVTDDHSLAVVGGSGRLWLDPVAQAAAVGARLCTGGWGAAGEWL